MPKKILIIEDEEYLSDMYRIKFEEEGYRAVVASNGLEGISLAKKEKPDLILLDLVLPKMDGYQVLGELRKTADIKNTKIYILSNLGQNKEVEQSFDRGADGYLLKASLTPSQLAEEVQKIFAGKEVGLKKQELKIKPTQKLASPASSSAKSETKARILLIEDQKDIIEMYKMRLEGDGYKVEVAQNGAWGLKLARENCYQAIVVDMVMPAMDGYTAIKELKANSKCKESPIVVLSNSAQDKDIEKAKKIGAAAYLIKARVTPAKLVKEIDKLLNPTSLR